MMKEGGAMGLISAPFNYEDGGLQLPLLFILLQTIF